VAPVTHKAGADDIDAVKRKHCDEQMTLDPSGQAALYATRSRFEFERPEGRFRLGQSPVSADHLIHVPLRAAGAQDIVTGPGVARVKRRIAFPGNGGGFSVRRFRDSDIIVAVDRSVALPQPSEPFENPVLLPDTALHVQISVQAYELGCKALTTAGENERLSSARKSDIYPHRSGGGSS